MTVIRKVHCQEDWRILVLFASFACTFGFPLLVFTLLVLPLVLSFQIPTFPRLRLFLLLVFAFSHLVGLAFLTLRFICLAPPLPPFPSLSLYCSSHLQQLLPNPVEGLQQSLASQLGRLTQRPLLSVCLKIELEMQSMPFIRFLPVEHH